MYAVWPENYIIMQNNNPFVSTIYLHVFINLKLSRAFCASQKGTQAQLCSWLRLKIVWCQLSNWFGFGSCIQWAVLMSVGVFTIHICNHIQWIMCVCVCWWNKWAQFYLLFSKPLCLLSIASHTHIRIADRARLSKYDNNSNFKFQMLDENELQSFVVFSWTFRQMCSVSNAYSKYGSYWTIHYDGRWAKLF